jgi:hypothetical protein
VKIRSSEEGSPAEERLYKVLSKGNENTIVMTVEPAAERGQILLMRGRDLWVFLPRVSQPVRLSLAQRLTGQVANGDIARANFAGDYKPHLVGTENAGKDSLYVLDLIAVDRKVTYPRVRFWVRQHDFRPHKAMREAGHCVTPPSGKAWSRRSGQARTPSRSRKGRWQQGGPRPLPGPRELTGRRPSPMIRLTALLVRNPDLTHDEFLRYWHDVHGPLMRDTPELARHIGQRRSSQSSGA